jgi:hypothetical protein
MSDHAPIGPGDFGIKACGPGMPLEYPYRKGDP